MADTVVPNNSEIMERELLAYLSRCAADGLTALRKEPAFNKMSECIRYVEGRHDEPGATPNKALSGVLSNRIKKVVLETTSALTDVRPIWNYETTNADFEDQGEILNKLARGWWKNGQVDRRLQSVLMFSCTGGSGYGMLSWNKDLFGGAGDFELIPLDPRDVIPIDPVYSDTIQDWRGVILRQRMPVAVARQMFPLKSAKINASSTSWAPNREAESDPKSNVLTSAWQMMKNSMDTISGGQQGVDIMRIFIKDECLYTGDTPVVMGEPGSNWSYTVSAGERLYPRGRLIICTPDAILMDIPNPYWHGMFPVIRFTLDALPWSLLGSAMVGDLIPLQRSLNEGMRGLDDGIAQWVKRGVIADNRTMAKATLDKLDTRRPGLRASVNPSVGEGFKIVEGPTFPEWYMGFIEFLVGQMDELSGVRGLTQLAQLRAMPSDDVMEKYTDALSPLLRLRSRSIELSLAELAEMLKVGFFQYYDAKRRMQILGQDGLSLVDFDYDPGSLVPAGDASREERALKHHKNFTFSIAPNSFLNVSHTTQKMLILQLFRANLLDPWTAWDAFDLPNIGKAPAETIPDRMIAARETGLLPGPTPQELQMQRAMMAAQAQAAIGQTAMMMQMGGGGAPQGGPPQQQAPRTSGVGPQGGRPPTGQEAPQFVTKDGGSRVVVSETGA